MNNSPTELSPQEVFERYIEAFSIKDYATVAGYFSIPALLISNSEPLHIDSSEKLTGLMQALRETFPAEYTHTTIKKFALYDVGDTSAAAHITYTRCAKDNTVLSTVQGVYYFGKDEKQWKMFSVVLMPSTE